MAVSRVGTKSVSRADLRNSRKSIDDVIKYVRALMKEVCGSRITLSARVPVGITKLCPTPTGDSTDLCVALRSLLAQLEEHRALLARWK